MLRSTSPSCGVSDLVRITFSGKGVLTVLLPNSCMRSSWKAVSMSKMYCFIDMVICQPSESMTSCRLTPNTNDESTISVFHLSFIMLLISCMTSRDVPYASQSSVWISIHDLWMPSDRSSISVRRGLGLWILALS